MEKPEIAALVFSVFVDLMLLGAVILAETQRNSLEKKLREERGKHLETQTKLRKEVAKKYRYISLYMQCVLQRRYGNSKKGNNSPY